MLTDHYGSPRRLADYRRQFEKTVRQDGEDPFIFMIELETLAVKAFRDVGPSSRIRMIRDRFIAGTILIVFRLRHPSRILLTDVEYGRAMPT